MSRVALLAGLTGLLLAFTVAAAGATPTNGPSAIVASYSCRGFNLHGDHYHVSVVKRHVRCRRARHVLRAFLHGKGRMHGPRNGPAYKQWWALYGWKCGHGAGGGGCSRHGVLVEAYWVP